MRQKLAARVEAGGDEIGKLCILFCMCRRDRFFGLRLEFIQHIAEWAGSIERLCTMYYSYVT